MLILIVQPDPERGEVLAELVRSLGMEARVRPTVSAVMAAGEARPDCLLLGHTASVEALAAALSELRAEEPRIPVIAVSPENDAATAMALVRAGADDYLVEPVGAEPLSAALHLALSRRRPGSGAPRSGASSHLIVGESAVMRQLEEQIRKVAHTHVPVFISGESGVGKEMVAHRIHEASARSAGPFVGLNCGALSGSLQDSELFGHEKGSFTGAIATRRGVFERAIGGVVFLDEVAELRPETQVRLLRVLQNGELTRLGGERTLPVNARVISATNKDIVAEVRAGRFREDLFYRLVVYPIRVPPLRERIDDLPALVHHFVRRYGAPGSEITDLALARLQLFPWPGNVRELENAIRLSLVNAENRTIDVPHLPVWVLHPAGMSLPIQSAEIPPITWTGSYSTLLPPPTSDLDPEAPAGPGLLKLAEREAIIAALVSTQGRVAFAARKLGLSRATLYRRIQHFGLCAEEFRQPTERMLAPEER